MQSAGRGSRYYFSMDSHFALPHFPSFRPRPLHSLRQFGGWPRARLSASGPAPPRVVNLWLWGVAWAVWPADCASVCSILRLERLVVHFPPSVLRSLTHSFFLSFVRSGEAPYVIRRGIGRTARAASTFADADHDPA